MTWQIYEDLSTELAKLTFDAPVTHVYNPLVYAGEPARAYVQKFASKKVRAILLGMNPGPWGMAQTGVPFGEVNLVRDFIGIGGHVRKPDRENPKRPIVGFDCKRSEVSGARLWGFARDRFVTAEAFFQRFSVLNYCPLVFMEASGKNFTPDKLRKSEQSALFAACDDALKRTLVVLDPEFLIGVGAFAEACLRRVAKTHKKISRILHPSPASPKANAGWAEAVACDLKKLDLLD